MNTHARSGVATTHVAAADCEQCRTGFIAQPANTISSAAFIAVGAAMLRRERRRTTMSRSERTLGWAAIAAGVGSVAYHGPGTAAGRYVHDAGLLAMLATLIASDAKLVHADVPQNAALVTVPVAGVLAINPAVSLVAQAAMGATAVAAETIRHQRLPAGDRKVRAGERAVAVIGVVCQVFGRTGGPLCRPSSSLQAHAVWHTAMALTLWFRRVDLDAAPVVSPQPATPTTRL